jgi:hypothetical protein
MTGALAWMNRSYLTGIAEKSTVPSVEDIEALRKRYRKSRLALTQRRKTSAMPLRFARRCEKNQILRLELQPVVGSRLSGTVDRMPSYKRC